MAWRRCARSRNCWRLAPQAYDITVFGAEPHGTYNRSCSRRCSPARSASRRSVCTRPSGMRTRDHAAPRRSRGPHRSRRAAACVQTRRRGALRSAADCHRFDSDRACRSRAASLPGVVTFRDLAGCRRDARPRAAHGAAAVGDRRRPAGARGGQRAAAPGHGRDGRAHRPAF